MAEAQPLVLIVDDALPIRALLRAGLAKAGYRSTEACDGAQGLELFLGQRPDLVLMDVNMPVMDGFQSCHAIREDDSEHTVPIIMLTGSDDYDSVNRAFDAGASDFIAKPVNLPLLIQRIRYALRDAQRERTLRRVQQQHDSARMLAGLAYWSFDLKTGVLSWAAHTPQLLPWLTPLPSTAAEFAGFVAPPDRKRYMDILNGAIHNDLSLDFEVRCNGPGGEEHILRILGQRDPGGDTLNGATQDLTQKRLQESRASYLDYHDVVTGLPNRKLFVSTLESRLQARTAQTAVAVVAIEIQRFQAISSAYGEDVSETLLRLVGNELPRLAGDEAFCARLDGPRFAIQLAVDAELAPPVILDHLGTLLRGLDRTWSIDGKDLFLRFSAGVCLAKEGSAQDPLTLLRMSTSALASVRPGSSHLTLALYQDGLHSSLRKVLRLETALRHAIENEEFQLFYQPQMDLSTQRIVGVEALLRWIKPDGASVSPAEFIPVLEDMGLITVLGKWILDEACRQQAAWSAEGLPLRMGINLSPVQFLQADLPLLVEAAASRRGACPRLVELEITESMAMTNPQASIKQLNQLREAGFKIAIDDFGIGFSSLEYLLRFPLNTLKIDQAFVKDLDQGRRDRAIVRALTSLSLGLGLTTIAEGVQTERQKDYLDALGVSEIQGYLLSRPVAAGQLRNFVRDFHAADSRPLPA